MHNMRLKALLGAACVSLALIGTAHAGGFDRGGVNIDQLFDPTPYSFDAGVTYVSPQRKLNNVQRLDGSGLTTSEVDVGGDYAVPHVGIKANVLEPVDCLATYTQPYGAVANYGMNNAYSPTAVKYEVNTNDFGLTCSYKVNVGKGEMQFIGGVSYQEVDAFLSRQTLLAFGNTGLGTFKLSDQAVGWRAGVAYEIPDIALRGTLMYYSSYKYDGLSGTVDTTGFQGGPLGNVTGVFPVTASAEIPKPLNSSYRAASLLAGWHLARCAGSNGASLALFPSMA